MFRRRLSRGRLQKIGLALRGSILGSLCWVVAHRYGTPGPGVSPAVRAPGPGSAGAQTCAAVVGWSYDPVFRPMDSTRYFEFDFAWRSLSDLSFQLPGCVVTSPVPGAALALQAAGHGGHDHPDAADLAWTAKVVWRPACRGAAAPTSPSYTGRGLRSGVFSGDHEHIGAGTCAGGQGRGRQDVGLLRPAGA